MSNTTSANIQITAGKATKVATAKNQGWKLTCYDVLINLIVELLPKAVKEDPTAPEAVVLLNDIEVNAGNMAMVRMSEILSARGFIVRFSISEFPDKSDKIHGIVVSPGKEKGWNPLF